MVNWLNSNQSLLKTGFHARVPHTYVACEPAYRHTHGGGGGLSSDSRFVAAPMVEKRRVGDLTRTDSDVTPSILQALRALMRVGMFVGQNKSR